MDPRTLIATRIDLQLRQHLGVRVDVFRALSDEAYMRDVLLVCDALPKTRLPVLARQFRVAAEQVALAEKAAAVRPGHDAGPAQDWAADTSGFGASQPLPPDATDLRQPAAPWYSPRRWLSD